MIQWIKSHPLYDVLIAVGLFLVFYLIARSGSSGAPSSSGGAGTVTYVQSGPSDAVQTASIAASAQQTQTQAALTAQSQQTQAEYNLGVAALTEKSLQDQLGANVSIAQTSAAASVANYGAQVQQNIADTEAAAQVQMNSDAVNGQVALAGYSSATTIATTHDNNLTQQYIANAQLQGWLAQIQAGVQQNDSDNAAAVATAGINANMTTTVAGYNAGVQIAGINADVAKTGIAADVTKTGIAADVAKTGIAADVTKTGIAAGQTVDLANIAASSAAYSKYLDVAGGLATQQETDANSQAMYGLSINQDYLTQLTQLKAYGKDTSGLPGTGITTAGISAAQPGNTAAAKISAWGSFIGSAAKAASAFV